MKGKQIFVIFAFLVLTYVATIVNIQETIGELFVGYFILLLMAFDSITDPSSLLTHEKRSEDQE